MTLVYLPQIFFTLHGEMVEFITEVQVEVLRFHFIWPYSVSVSCLFTIWSIIILLIAVGGVVMTMTGQTTQ